MKFSIKEAQEELEISRAKLYNLFKILKIQTQKKGRKSYISVADLNTIKNHLRDEELSRQNIHSETPESPSSKDSSTDSLDTLKQAHTEEIERIRADHVKQQEAMQERLSEKEQEIKDLSVSLGQWQGRAKTLEEQHTKLLEAQSVVEEEEVEEAKLIEKKKGFFKRWFS